MILGIWQLSKEVIMNIFPFLLSKNFDEEKFIRQCLRGFAKIRNQYNIDKDEIERLRFNVALESLISDVLSGYTEKDIMKLARKIPGWENREIGISPFGSFWGPVAWCVDPMKFNKNDNQTVCWIEKMMQFYEEKCKSLCHALSQMKSDIKLK